MSLMVVLELSLTAADTHAPKMPTQHLDISLQLIRCTRCKKVVFRMLPGSRAFRRPCGDCEGNARHCGWRAAALFIGVTHALSRLFWFPDPPVTSCVHDIQWLSRATTEVYARIAEVDRNTYPFCFCGPVLDRLKATPVSTCSETCRHCGSFGAFFMLQLKRSGSQSGIGGECCAATRPVNVVLVEDMQCMRQVEISALTWLC